MKLTNTTCKNAKPLEKQYKLFDGGGLYLLVKPGGAKHWRLKYRIHGSEKLLAIGPYPFTSLAEARSERDAAKKLIAEGIDPVMQKRKEKHNASHNAENTFKAIALEWYENRLSRWTPRYAEEVLKRLEQDIFPEIGAYPIKEIEPPILLAVIRKIESRGAHELAKRQLQKCGEIFRYAIASGKAVRDPSRDIGDALKPVTKGHFAALDVKELPNFIRAIEANDARLYQNTRNALKLIMLTFVRTSELIGARWDEIDFEGKQWLIPAERMKMKKEHIVPLSSQAIRILRDQQEIAGQWPLVFPSTVRPKQAISNNTILGAIKRLGYQGRMTGHGFRALAMSTIKQELGYRHEVVDRQLAHIPKNKIDKAYDRADFLKERVVMMQEWADYLDAIASDGKVIVGEFRKRV